MAETRRPRGRPVHSVVRYNMVDILGYTGKAYGYEIYKHYRTLFPKITLRLIYYHLHKGVTLGEIEKVEVKKKKGDYSWGSETEQHYYKVGRNGNPHRTEQLDTHFKKKAR